MDGYDCAPLTQKYVYYGLLLTPSTLWVPTMEVDTLMILYTES